MQAALNLLFVVFFFGFSIFIHEFGHLLAAMWRGLHVERFSIGFGKPLMKWRKWDIDFMVSMIPFGGYVALPQLDPSDQPKTFDGQPLPLVKPVDRIITAVAGPVFNIAFGLFLGCFVWQIGVKGPPPAKSFVVGFVPKTYQDAKGNEHPNPEFEAGLEAGDEIFAVNGESFERGYTEAFELIVYSPHGEAALDVRRNGMPLTITYRPAPNPRFEGLTFPFFGPFLETAVGKLDPDSPAARAGIQENDVLKEINGERIINPDLLIQRIQEIGANELTIVVARGSELLSFHMTPEKQLRKGEEKERYLVGMPLAPVRPEPVELHPTPWQQFTAVFDRTKRTMRGLADPNNTIAPKHMSGPLGIAGLIYRMVSIGIMKGLEFVILVNFSLALLNLLPLPILDGGHITSAIIQAIVRRRMPTTLAVGLQYVFAVLLISFMLYVTFYDVLREWRHVRRDHLEQAETAPATPPSEVAPPASAPSGVAPAAEPAQP